MDPVKKMCTLSSAVAQGLVGDMQRDHGASNVDAGVRACSDTLSACAQSASKVEDTPVLPSASLDETRGVLSKLNADLRALFDAERVTRDKVEALENEYMQQRMELQNALHHKLFEQEEKHKAIARDALK